METLSRDYELPAWLLGNVSDLRKVTVCHLIEWQKMSSKPSSEKPWLLPSICCSNRAGEFSFVSEAWESKKEIQFLAS